MNRKGLWPKLAVFLMVTGLIAMIGCSAAEQTFTGTVEQTDQGLVLTSSDGANTYRVMDNPDIRALAGKSVQLTGTLMDREAGQTIAVTNFEILEEEGASATSD